MVNHEQLLLCDLNYAEALREYTRNAGGRILDEDGLALMTAPHWHFVANNAFVCEPKLDAIEIMARTTAFFRPLGRAFAINVPEHGAGKLSEGIEQQGALRVVSAPAMILSQRLADPALPPGVRLASAEDSTGHRDFVAVAADAWSTYSVPGDGVELMFARPESVARPHLRTVIAYFDGRPAAAAQVLLSHGIAGIYWVSTAAAARRRGLAEICTRAVGNLAFDLGARFVTLQASPMGEPIYRRMGYAEVSRYTMLLGPTS